MFFRTFQVKMADSDSDGEENLLVVDEGDDTKEEVDDSICPICRGSTYVGETISCETCTYWFHFECVGVNSSHPCVLREDVPFYCSKCKKPTKKAKSKPKKAAPTTTPKSKKSSSKKASPTPKVTPSPTIKLKISIGKKKSKSQAIELSPPRQSTSKRRIAEATVVSVVIEDNSTTDSPLKKRKRLNSADEEEKWLDAVEAGTLHAVDEELKNIRDPKLMTARQRAMVVRQSDDFVMTDEESGHMALAYTNKKDKAPVDEVEILRVKAIKSAKRKEVELEKREQDRKKTMDRLLNKRESTVLKSSLKSALAATGDANLRNPKITYIHTKNGPSLTFPPFMDIPIPTLKRKKPPEVIKCSVKLCKNAKKYNCSQTGRPLCSLQCYKKNLTLLVK